jgi:hypothetical protein
MGFCQLLITQYFRNFRRKTSDVPYQAVCEGKTADWGYLRIETPHDCGGNLGKKCSITELEVNFVSEVPDAEARKKLGGLPDTTGWEVGTFQIEKLHRTE